MSENINEPENKDTVAEWAEELGMPTQPDANVETNEVATEAPVEEVNVSDSEEIVEELSKVKKVDTFKMPDFAVGFRGFDKSQVEAFISKVLKAYNELAKKDNSDSSVLLNANKLIQSQKKKIESLEKKVSHLESGKDEAALEKKAAHIIAKAEADAKKILDKANADAKKHINNAVKIAEQANAKSDKIIDAANAKALKALEKAVKDASSIVEKGKTEILEARKIIASNKENNDRLVAFYTTQIKALKAQNKKNTK